MKDNQSFLVIIRWSKTLIPKIVPALQSLLVISRSSREYRNNNWVKIYDTLGNEVFSIDMPFGDARFEADLPDGMYTVKTFHDGFETPIQEFIIGKP